MKHAAAKTLLHSLSEWSRGAELKYRSDSVIRMCCN
jgi:hypothetical protein